MSENKKDMTFAVFFRKIFDWEWYTDSNTFHLFFHCIMRANHKPNSYQGIPLKRGQFVTGRKKLSVETGLSEQQIRTILKRLQSTNEITIRSNYRNSIITVNNYDEYQSYFIKKRKNQPAGTPANNQPLTTNNNDNKERDNKLSLSIEEREILKKYFLELNEKRKNKIEDIDAYIRKLVENGDCLTKLEKAKKKLERQKAKEVIPPPENFEKSTPEEDKAGLELLRETARQIRKRG